MAEKMDRRIRKTKAQLRHGLAKLLKEKTIKEITVKELVEEVDIKPEYKEVKTTISATRLDAIIAAAFKASRSSMTGLIAGGKVFVNGKLITSNGYEPKEGDIISVRGKGRFIYDGVSRQTKKGRLGVRIRKYV